MILFLQLSVSTRFIKHVILQAPKVQRFQFTGTAEVCHMRYMQCQCKKIKWVRKNFNANSVHFFWARSSESANSCTILYALSSFLTSTLDRAYLVQDHTRRLILHTVCDCTFCEMPNISLLWSEILR